MNRIAQFEKVSLRQFEEGCRKCFPEMSLEEMQKAYDSIELPRRATSGSAGYDFHAPFAFSLQPGQSYLTPTGIRARIEPGWVLMLFMRSSLGFRYRLQLDNTVGIIDSDYYHADNEGHIFVRLSNDSNKGKSAVIEAGDSFLQGVFVPFGLTADDDAFEKRSGGFGSTDVKGTK